MKKNLTERQEKILHLIIEEYIKSGEPVSSQLLIDKYALSISSATIRNEMVFLEENDFIQKSNFSSGRIPTNKSYAWHLNEQQTNTSNIQFLKDKINNLFKNRIGNVESVLEECVRVINDATKLTAITKEVNKDARLEDLKIYQISNGKLMVLLVFNNGHVLHNEINLGAINIEDLKTSIKILFERLKGTKINELLSTAQNVKLLVSNNVKSIEENFQKIILAMFENLGIENYKLSGLNNLITSAQVRSLETAKKIISVLESHSIWNFLDHSSTISSNGTNITLELTDDKLQNISVITKDIDISDDKKTSLTFVGPKNQDYKILVELLKTLEDNIKNL